MNSMHSQYSADWGVFRVKVRITHDCVSVLNHSRNDGENHAISNTMGQKTSSIFMINESKKMSQPYHFTVTKYMLIYFIPSYDAIIETHSIFVGIKIKKVS